MLFENFCSLRVKKENSSWSYKKNNMIKNAKELD